MNEIIYICPIKYYPNCRGHDGGDYSSTKFFENKEQLLDFVLKEIDRTEILEIYNSQGYKVGNIEYELSSCKCSGIKVTIEDYKYRTVDDGKGILIWDFFGRKIK